MGKKHIFFRATITNVSACLEIFLTSFPIYKRQMIIFFYVLYPNPNMSNAWYFIKLSDTLPCGNTFHFIYSFRSFCTLLLWWWRHRTKAIAEFRVHGVRGNNNIMQQQLMQLTEKNKEQCGCRRSNCYNSR